MDYHRVYLQRVTTKVVNKELPDHQLLPVLQVTKFKIQRAKLTKLQVTRH